MPPVLTAPISQVIEATPRTRIVRVSVKPHPFPYRAGQAALVAQHGHPGRRPYSIASAPEETRRHGCLEFLLHVDAHGSPGAHLPELRRGVALDVEGPLGSFRFPPNARARRILFVAGGTGIAPLRAMLVHALLTRTPARLALLYSARTPQEFAYVGELSRLARAGRIELRLTASRPAGPAWKGERGRITRSRLAAMVDDAEPLCFVCGPRPLIKDVHRWLRQLGVPGARILREEW